MPLFCVFGELSGVVWASVIASSLYVWRKVCTTYKTYLSRFFPICMSFLKGHNNRFWSFTVEINASENEVQKLSPIYSPMGRG